MGVLIDSDVLIDWERGLASAAAVRRGGEEAFISVVSASELLHGVHRAPDARTRQRRQAFVEGLLSALPVLDIDLSVARRHAQLWSELQRKGHMIGLHDAWLAATCLAHGLRLITRNARELQQVPGLHLDVW